MALIIISGNSLAYTGARLLAVEAGARPAGMGGAFVAITADPYSAAYNPAAVFGVNGIAGSFGYNTYWADTKIQSGYVIFEKRSIAFNFGIQLGQVGDIEAYGDAPTAEPLYLFEYQDVSFKGGAAFKVHRAVSVGFSVGWVFEKIDNYRGHAVNGDFGILVTPKENLNVGASATYIGQKLKLDTEEYELPASYRLGVSYKLDKFLPVLDFVREDGQNHLHGGMEYNFMQMFYLRAGYRTNYDARDLSAGLGFTHRNFRVDYAYLPYSENLDDSHLINLTFSL